MAEDDEEHGSDTLQLIEVSALLPCGVSGCAQMTHHARIERHPDHPALYLLLPLCDLHLRRMSAPAPAPTDAPASAPNGSADSSDSVGPVAAR